MKPRIKKLIRKAYEEYTSDMDCIQMPMEGYLGCLYDLGLSPTKNTARQHKTLLKQIWRH